MTDLERRIQVEEAWARRRVLAQVINAERYIVYRTRRDLACPDEPLPAWRAPSRKLELELDFAGLRY